MVFYNTCITTICPTGDRYYSQLGAYSQIEHVISLVICNTLYETILFSLCIIYLKHVCLFPQKPKPHSLNACPRMLSSPNRGKTHGNKRAHPDNNRQNRHHWRQTGPALRIYTSNLYDIMDTVNQENKHRVIIGDMNVELLKYEIHSKTNEYLDGISEHGFLTVISKPSRICKSSATQIDHIYVNDVTYPHTFIINNISVSSIRKIRHITRF